MFTQEEKIAFAKLPVFETEGGVTIRMSDPDADELIQYIELPVADEPSEKTTKVRANHIVISSRRPIFLYETDTDQLIAEIERVNPVLEDTHIVEKHVSNMRSTLVCFNKIGAFDISSYRQETEQQPWELAITHCPLVFFNTRAEAELVRDILVSEWMKYANR